MSDAQEDDSEMGISDTQAPAAAAPTAQAPPSAEFGADGWAPGPGLSVRYAGRSAVGLVREHNEDNFVISNLTTGEISARESSIVDNVGEGGLMFAVCDGMGGAAAGEVASQMAVDVLQQEMRRGGLPRERDELARRLVNAVEEAGRRIFEAAQKERSRRGMGTTATAAVLVDKVLFIAEVGDSRAYMLRGGMLKQLTKDQSLVNQLIEAGHLTEAEAEAFEHSNIILQALGTSETVQVDLTFVELRRGDRLMICSDGLSGLVHGDTLRDALASVDDPSECTATLVKYAEAGGGHDNITVVVIDFDGDALELPLDTDTFGYLQYPLLPAGAIAGAFSDEEITEASLSQGRLSHDSMPAIEPGNLRAGESSPWLWISAGLLALLLGAWLLAASGSSNSATADEARGLQHGVAPAEPQVAKAPDPLEQKPVQVRVFSDVQDAVLLVNGEAHGRLADAEGHALELRPGAYRFEAQSNGNIAAVEVVTVRPDVPLEVHLRLPTGMNDPSAHHAVAAEAKEPDQFNKTEPSAKDGLVAEANADGVEAKVPEGAKPGAGNRPAASGKPAPAVSIEHKVARNAGDAEHAAREHHVKPSDDSPPPTAAEPPATHPAPPANAPAVAPVKAPTAIPDNPF